MKKQKPSAQNAATNLKLDWCSYEAAKYAVMRWHYSKAMPAGKLSKIGVWENEKFIGVIIFSRGAAPQAHCPYGIGRLEVCELTRVSLCIHKSPVSQMVAVSLRLLRKQSPGIRLVVSYADPERGHHGGIYAAGGWVYTGPTQLCEQFEWSRTGERVHTKTICTGRRGYATQLKKRGLLRVVKVWKHKYVMPLDKKIRANIYNLSKPYPKRARSIDSDAACYQHEEGGATPTLALSKVV